MGTNKYRWNQRGENCKANGEKTSGADRTRFGHLHVCDGPSTQLCDGNTTFTQQNIDTMVEEVEAARAVEAMSVLAMELALVDQVGPVATTAMSGRI